MARPRSFSDPDILTRAMLVFWQSGFGNSNVRQLEAATGLKMSSLYNRFDSKEKLFEEVLDHYLDKVVRWRIKRYLHQQPDPLAGIAHFLHSCYEYIDTEHGRPPVACLLSNTALELGMKDPGIGARINNGMTLVQAGFRDALRDAVVMGQISNTVDIDRTARQLLLGLQGLLIESKLIDDKATLASLTDDILAMIPGRY